LARKKNQGDNKMAETKNLLLFRKWDLSNIEIKDPGLKTAISLRKQILPYTYGRSALKRFNKADVNIVERLVNKTMHFGKKYAKNTGRMTGKKARVLNLVKTSFDIMALKTGQNPVELLVRAVENSAPNEDTTRIVYGGTVYHVSVDVAPIRRVDLALKFISDAIKESTFSNPKPIEEHMAEQIMLAAANDPNAPSVKKKNELERIAQASR
jgi:small subunit ribosomal protein S7